ncbi:hypothetical protein HY498_04775 [Candidatus Woesearchaeota archaeon]|nr:hypothetical protein [Candidatus Woesearchaeota archaeon]
MKKRGKLDGRKFKRVSKEQKLLRMSEISLILDSYDDIFSDFDSRSYSERALSDDFLQEARRASRDKAGEMELKFLVPRKIRNKEQEKNIKKRLCEHFKKHYKRINDEIKHIKKEGIFMTMAGAFIILSATYLAYLQSSSFLIEFFIVLLQPAGWFIGWTGLDQIYYGAKEKKPSLEFYEKMSMCNISFGEY